MDDTTLLGSSWLDIQKFFGINGYSTADRTWNMSDAQVKTVTDAATMQNTGMLLTMFGGVSSAVSSYFQAQSQQYQYKSEALNLGYQADMAAINARSAEYTAEGYLESSKAQIQKTTIEAGQQKASATASMASRGIALGQGSAQEVTASQDLMKDISVYSINANATREAAQARIQATNYNNQALLDRTGAQNARLSASSVSPFSSVMTSLMGSASSVASQWNNSQRMKMMYANGYPGGYSVGGG